jgi:Holliday junction DNA helicase RuvA
MIGKLKGRVDEIFGDAVLLDVGGVGYHVFASTRTLAALAEGQAATLTIETHVREDHIHLYGFSDTYERDWFKLLVSVQGVGNRIALAILSARAPEHIAQAIMAKDVAAFKAISGIGPKLAERIVTELKDKVLVDSGQWAVDSKAKKNPSTVHRLPSTVTDDAISALVNLGYSRSDAYGATLKASQEGKNLDQIIKLSLKELARA